MTKDWYGPSAWRASSPAWSAALQAAVLLAVTVAAYLPVLRAGYVWDDPLYVTDNALLRTPGGLWAIWLTPAASSQYYPLGLTIFWVGYHLWGLNPLGYHLTNLLLHAANVLLVLQLLRRLAVPGASFAAALFALHPVEVESVAWISEGQGLLAVLFSLLTLLVWLWFLQNRAGRRYLLALLLFAAALLSKTTVCPLPLILALLSWCRTRPGRRGWDAVGLVPFVLLSAVLASATVWREHVYSPFHLIAQHLSAIERGLIAGRALWFYVGKLVWPLPLMTIYPRWQIDADAAWQYGFPAAAAAVLCTTWWLRARLGTGVLLAVWSYALALAPTLGLVDFDFMRLSYVADHFVYGPSIPLLALAAAGFACLAGRANLPLSNLVVRAGAAVVLLALALMTRHQTGRYRDAETFLWRATIVANPDAWIAHYNLGTAFYRENRALDEALEHFAVALRLRPDYAMAHTNYAAVLDLQGKVAAAVPHLQAAVQLEPDNARFHFNLGRRS